MKMVRKGMGRGQGKGYKNMIGVDSKVHSMSSKGIKQPQKLNIVRVAYGLKTTPKNLREYKIEGRDSAVGTFNEFKEKFPNTKIKIVKPLTAKQKVNQNYEKYIIDSIDAEGYNQNPRTEKEKLQFLKDTFKTEYGFMIGRVGEQNAFKEWLQGLPSVISIPFYNDDILKFAKKMGSLPENATAKQEERVIDNYWNFMANKTFQVFKKYGVN